MRQGQRRGWTIAATGWIGAVLAGAVLLTLSFLALSVPAWAGSGVTRKADPKTVSVWVNNRMGANAKFCLKTTTTMKRPRGSDRSCTGWMMTATNAQLTADITDQNDEVFLDSEVDTSGGTGGTSTSDDKLITGATTCTIYNVTASYKVECDTPSAKPVVVSPPAVAPFALNNSDPNDPGIALLSLLAWCVSAAAVAGLIVTGINMALQMRRGEPGESSEHWRGFLYVGGACLLGLTAGPLVSFLGLPY
ncbi:hypothetical protein KRM28CT15_52120 [Krasilnikovia sp. M28-CT-15]